MWHRGGPIFRPEGVSIDVVVKLVLPDFIALPSVLIHNHRIYHGRNASRKARIVKLDQRRLGLRSAIKMGMI